MTATLNFILNAIAGFLGGLIGGRTTLGAIMSFLDIVALIVLGIIAFITLGLKIALIGAVINIVALLIGSGVGGIVQAMVWRKQK